MTGPVAEPRSYTGNPQKNSPALGATIAYMGVDGLLALLHGSQGCSTFIRLQLSRHFKEPIPLNSTALLEDTAIFGGWEHLKKGIAKAADKFQPRIIGVMSSGLTETFGDDMVSALASLRQERPDLIEKPVVLAKTPDYIGSLQEGYQRTVLALLDTLTVDPSPRESNTVALFPGAHFTPADVEELKDTVSLFGLTPLVLPDISTSLDGHFELEPAPVVQGGITLEDIRRIPGCIASFSFGPSMAVVGESLQKRHSVPHIAVPSLTGLEAVDTFYLKLCQLSGRPIPERLLRQRSRLLDTLADYHDQLGQKRIAIALESDLLISLANCLVEVGAVIQVALAATALHENVLPNFTFSSQYTVEVGDLEHLEERAPGSHLIIANSNARQAALPLKIPHLRAGLPVFDRAGMSQKVWIGYRGTQQFLYDCLNAMAG
ncbi:nitrogenase iron-molybdenum cofactor biosynthesis protein NifN [Heliobacterium chlorum]|uniref:Nitrogenase iron-molybdenum cofactor biosynthesis protein NifN n=1 Tax=Heliobacterium chlorum TaxID=2698 RepID=Q53U97_HELCL|nr:nitrogenase iron-molybdenum cofactor biosynthesis protein NifN [Heliobacterium chlorum]MBC9785154.1 nitrogenase iron-molybdenum cofactor biosynthesis protein NifN [Heliobacterium chlorum]BAD95757.1 NifN [Heliobacterium chlorum]